MDSVVQDLVDLDRERYTKEIDDLQKRLEELNLEWEGMKVQNDKFQEQSMELESIRVQADQASVRQEQIERELIDIQGRIQQFSSQKLVNRQV